MTSAAIKAANDHARRLIAARILLDQWALFAEFVAFARDDGAHVARLELHVLRPDGACWRIRDDETEEVLVATVAGGAKYLGWDEALTQADGVAR